MKGIAIGIPFGRKSAYDSEVQTIFDNFTGTYSLAIKKGLNDFIVATKQLFSIDLLNEKFDTFYVIGDGADSKLNLANLGSNTMTEGNSPVINDFTSYQTNGTNYFNTNYNPSADGVNVGLNNSATLVYLVEDSAFRSGIAYGAATAVPSNFTYLNINAAKSFNGSVNDSGTAVVSGAVANTLGLHTITRTGNDLFLYQNNSQIGTATNAPDGLTNFDEFFGGANYGGVLNQATARQGAFIARCSHITLTQQQQFLTLLETYLDIIGAGVL